MELGLPTVNKEEIIKVMREGKIPWEVLIPKNIDHREELVHRSIELALETFTPTYIQEAKPIHGTLEVLKELSRKGIPVGVATSAWGEEVIVVLRKFNLDKFIKVVIRRGDVTRNKPAPDVLLKCAEKLGFPPEECLYVGDSPIDVKTGKAAGTPTIAVLTGVGDYESLSKEKPLKIVKDIKELLNYLD